MKCDIQIDTSLKLHSELRSVQKYTININWLICWAGQLMLIVGVKQALGFVRDLILQIKVPGNNQF